MSAAGALIGGITPDSSCTALGGFLGRPYAARPNGQCFTQYSVYDALVDERILEHARPGAAVDYAGKRGGKPSPKQRDITLKMIALARAGKLDPLLA